LLLLLAIADHAHPDGTNAFPSQHTLAKKTRLSVRQVRRLLDRLVDGGELKIEERPGTTALMTVLMGADKMSGVPAVATAPDGPTSADMAMSPTRDMRAAGQDTAASYEPSSKPSLTRPGTIPSEDGALRAPAFESARDTRAPRSLGSLPISDDDAMRALRRKAREDARAWLDQQPPLPLNEEAAMRALWRKQSEKARAGLHPQSPR
jgi:hypothetical protein